MWDSYKHMAGSCSHNPVKALAEAKQRLDTLFYFVGVTEDFVGSMFLLQRTFGWGPASVQGAFQKSMKAFCDGECKQRYRLKDVSNATLKLVVANEAKCDEPLWQHAASLLASRLHAMAAADVKAYAAFKVRDHLPPLTSGGSVNATCKFAAVAPPLVCLKHRLHVCVQVMAAVQRNARGAPSLRNDRLPDPLGEGLERLAGRSQVDDLQGLHDLHLT